VALSKLWINIKGYGSNRRQLSFQHNLSMVLGGVEVWECRVREGDRVKLISVIAYINQKVNQKYLSNWLLLKNLLSKTRCNDILNILIMEMLLFSGYLLQSHIEDSDGSQVECNILPKSKICKFLKIKNYLRALYTQGAFST
jgi:hypothetical protein